LLTNDDAQLLRRRRLPADAGCPAVDDWGE
jgi:hypothetical protein